MKRGVVLLLTILMAPFTGIPLLKGEIHDFTRTTVYVDPSENWGAVGETFQINVSIYEVTNLFGYEFKLFYDTRILDGIKIEAPPDHFLAPTDPTKIFWAKQGIRDDFNATHGQIWVAVTLLAPEEPKNGNGTLVTITFLITEPGECLLNLFNSKLATPMATPIPHDEVDGEFLLHHDQPER